MVFSRARTLARLALAAVVVIVFWLVPAFDAGNASADPDGPAMSLSVNGQSGEADVEIGTPFTVVVHADAIPANGYVLAQTYLVFDNNVLTFKGSQTIWPDCAAADLDDDGAGFAWRGCLTGFFDPPPSFHKGPLYSFDFNCPDSEGSHTIGMVQAEQQPAKTRGALFVEFATHSSVVPHVDSIDINCVTPPAVGGGSIDGVAPLDDIGSGSQLATWLAVSAAALLGLAMVGALSRRARA